MMSDSDAPSASGIPVAAAVAQSTAEDAASKDENIKQVWRFIYIDMAFVKSLYGMFVAGELGLSLLALISVSVPKNEGCAYLYSSTYSYFEFVASSCFIISLVWYLLYLLRITTKLGFVRWDLAEMVWLGFYIFNYFIGSCVIAAHACRQGGYGAAAVFGFLCCGVLVAHEFFEVRAFLEKRRNASAGTSTGAQNATDEESKY